jgi:predicted RNA-binding protein with RPS1 domain
MEYGIFVDLGGNISGLVHVSELSTEFIKDVNSKFSVGDEVDVMYVGKDERGRIKLSIKAIAEEKKSSDNSGEESRKTAEQTGNFRQIKR